MKTSNRYFISGTDTGIGKTVLSLLLMQYFYQTGKNPFYIKMIQTGCRDPYDTDSDAQFIYRNVEPLKIKDPAESVPFCFTNPKAPWFASRDDGKLIDLHLLSTFVDKKSAQHSPLVLEGAGGLFVPVDATTLMVDLVSMLNAEIILAARAGLGTINHALLSIEALRVRGIRIAGVVFLDSGETAEDMVRENMEALEKLAGIKVAGTIGRITDFSNPAQECFRTIAALVS